MGRATRVLLAFTLSLIVIGNTSAQQPQTTQMASLRPNPELHWQRTSPTPQETDGPVLYQLVFTPGTTGTIAKFDTNPRHLTNSDITDVGTIVAIGSSGFMINAGTGMVTFVNGQLFPGTGTVTSVSNTDGFVSITSPTTTPVINLNTTKTDARYVLKVGDTMTGPLNLPGNGLVAGGSQLVLSGGKVGIGTNGPNAQLQVIGPNGADMSANNTSGNPGDPGLNATGGSGGQVFGANDTGGVGGSPSIRGGAGGSVFGFNSNGGPGGSVTIAGGDGGSANLGFSGNGGDILIEPGAGQPSGRTIITSGMDADSTDNDNGTISSDASDRNRNNVHLLLFGAGNTGEGIGSQRASNGGGNGNNQFGLDFYTGFTKRMYIDIGGTVHVLGNLIKPAGSFQIDHPLDPANKYLSHSFVESPDMKNVYDGIVTLNAKGQAWVELPNYFEALNQDFRYQLTPIGNPGQHVLYIAKEIAGNRFKIAGGRPGAKVSWQVTGIRHDAYANAHRIQVEEDKGEKRGTYLHPELFEKQETAAVTAK